MRILHVTKRWPDAKGGDAVIARNLARRQRDAGHSVAVLTSNCRSIRTGPDVHAFGLPLADAEIDQINLRRIVSLLWLFVSSFMLLRRLRPEVIHVHAVDMGLAVAVAARFSRIPMVLTLHGTALGSPFLSPAKQRLEGLLIRWAGYRFVLSVSEDSLPDLIALGSPLAADTVAYLPNAVVVEDFAATEVPVSAPLLFIGRLEHVKGVDVLLPALARARARGAALSLRLVGSGSLQARLRALADDLDLADVVEFLGAQDEDRTQAELASCGALVLPSMYEGFPLVILEAWASGRPVVATRVGAVPRICEDDGDALTVTAGDVDELSEALFRIGTDHELAKRLGKSGRQKVEHQYSDVRMAEAVAATYARVTALDRTRR